MSEHALRLKLAEVGRQGMPTDASLEVTHRCNASCPYCYLHFAPRADDATTETVCRMIDRLADAGVLSLLVTGGEPFVRGDILDILEHAVRRDFFRISLYTNMTLMRQEHLDWIVAHSDRVNFVKASVFSHIPSINDGYFGVPGALDAILRNARRLMDGGVRVKMTLTAIEENVDHIGETVDALESLGLDVPASPLKTVVSPDHAVFQADSMSVSFFERYFKSLPRTHRDPVKKRLLRSLEKPSRSTELCMGRMSRIAVDPQGCLSPCLVFRGDYMGTILTEEGIDKLLSSSDFRQKLMGLTKMDIEECRHCRFVGFCNPCPGINFNTGGNLTCLSSKQYCNYAKAVNEL